MSSDLNGAEEVINLREWEVQGDAKEKSGSCGCKTGGTCLCEKCCCAGGCCDTTSTDAATESSGCGCGGKGKKKF